MSKKELVENHQYIFDESVPNRLKEIRGTLPDYIKNKFSVMYEHTYEGFENIFIFTSFDRKWGVLKFEKGHYILLVENMYDSTGTHFQYGLIEAVICHAGSYSGQKSYLFF